MEMGKRQGRIEWIDMAKGYGILLVIIAHLPVGNVEYWINTFHMPLFFFLSGYVFHVKDSFFTFLKKRVKGLLVPYFFLGLVIILFETLLSLWKHQFSIKAVGNLFLALFLQKRTWTLWYLAVLFFMNLVFYWIVKWAKKHWQVLLISVLMAAIGLAYYGLGGTALFWNIDVVLPAMPFMAAGYVAARYDYLWEKGLKKPWLAMGLVLILAAVTWGFEWMSYQIAGHGLWMFYNKYGMPVCTYVAALTGTACVCIIARLVTLRPIRYLGENTLVYFGWHQSIMIFLANRLLNELGFYLLDTSSTQFRFNFNLAMLIIILFTLTVCNVILTKTKLKVLLGK